MKQTFLLDAFFLSLQGDPETLVFLSRYYLQLFSHQRQTFLWKGMVQVRIEDLYDALAREYLEGFMPQAEPGESQL